jgi:hypothetical protein
MNTDATTMNINDLNVKSLNEIEFKDTLIMSLIKLNDDCDIFNTNAKYLDSLITHDIMNSILYIKRCIISSALTCFIFEEIVRGGWNKKHLNDAITTIFNGLDVKTIFKFYFLKYLNYNY